MGERFPGDPAAANGFGRRTLQPWEAHMMYDAGYMAPLDIHLSAGGIPIPPLPKDEKITDKIQAAIAAMEDPNLAENPGNLLFWEQHFAHCWQHELARHKGPPGSPSKRNNTASRRHWWSAPGRTLAAVLEHIHAGNEAHLGFPRNPMPASRARRDPPANWLPRRMASLFSSSSSAASASCSSGSTPATSPPLRPVKREPETPVRSPPRTRAHNIVINEPRAPSPPIGRFCLR